MDELGEQRVGSLDFVREDGDRRRRRSLVVQVDHVQDRRGRGDVAAGVAAHAVRYDGEVPAHVGGVVVLGADTRPTSERAA